MKLATLIGGLIAVILTLIWVSVMAVLTMLDGGIFAALPLAVTLYVSWKLYRLIRWIWIDEERFDNLTNFVTNLVIVLKVAKEKRPTKTRQLFKQMCLPPEEFEKQFKGI